MIARQPHRRGFTLVEVLTAFAIAMVLAGVCTTALVQIRAMVKRAQLRIALHQRAESLYVFLQNSFAALQGSGPLVVDAVAAGGGSRTPRLRLLALTSKLDNWDWSWPREGGNESPYMGKDTSDLRWLLLDWNGDPADQRLYAATSSPSRSFTPSGSLRNPAASTINYQSRSFLNLPQPRRSLGAIASWADATTALDANMLFPDPASSGTYPDTPRSSLAGSGDVGDWGDLLRQRTPIASGITDFRITLVEADGTVRSFDQTATAFRNHDGAWLDGNLTAAHGTFSGTAATALAGPIGQRPRLARVRMTLEARLVPRDPAVPDSDATRIQQVFSFSFLLPGNAGPPSGP